MTDTQNVMPSIQKYSSSSGSGLMSPNTLPISKGHNVANNITDNGSSSSSIDGSQMVNDDQLLRLQNYNLLYNAERQTYFQLHTSNKPWQYNRSSPTTFAGNRLLHQVVGNTLSAAFGLNTNANTNSNSGMNTMATMMTTQTVRLYDAASLRQSRYNPFNPTR
ncbi:hypothetical protein ACLKA6_019897 [Drosophila palustris]